MRPRPHDVVLAEHCGRRLRFEDAEAARAEAARLSSLRNAPFEAYLCVVEGVWHVHRVQPPEELDALARAMRALPPPRPAPLPRLVRRLDVVRGVRRPRERR